MPIRTDIQTEALPAQFRAQRTVTRKGQKRSDTEPSGASAPQKVRSDVYLQAQISASGLQSGQVTGDRVAFQTTLGYQSNSTEYRFCGTVELDTMRGRVTLGEYGEADWSARRIV